MAPFAPLQKALATLSGRGNTPECPDCGTAITTEQGLCPSCGVTVTVECRTCGETIGEAVEECPSCGGDRYEVFRLE